MPAEREMKAESVMVLLALMGLAAGDPQYNLPEAGAMVNRVHDPSASSRMDALADETTLRIWRKLNAGPGYFVFTEDRANAVRWSHGVPAHWLRNARKHLGRFSGTAAPGEFYVFQVAVFSPVRDTGPLDIKFSPLKPGDVGGAPIPATAFRCISLGGIGPDGERFEKLVTVRAGTLETLWIGVAVPQEASDAYSGSLTVKPEGVKPTAVEIALQIEGEPLRDHGESDAWRLARLRWLDSRVGHADTPVAPFTPVSQRGARLTILGRRVLLGPNGLPRQVLSYFSGSNTHLVGKGRPLLAGPMTLEADTESGPAEWRFAETQSGAKSEAACEWETCGATDALEITTTGRMAFDGHVRFRNRLRARRDVIVKEVRLRIPMRRDVARYLMGLGFKGGTRPRRVDWNWDVRRHQDAAWIGDVNAGLQLRLKGANYARPLVNIYYDFKRLALPESWGSGGMRLREEANDIVSLIAFAGPHVLRRGEQLALDFDLYLTPFKRLDLAGQWKHRYLHSGDEKYYDDPALAAAEGATVLNMHHARQRNPFINYPYNDRSFPDFVQCVRKAHENGLLLKPYYTTREITNHMPELYALKSLDGEVICRTDVSPVKTVINRDGPHPWLVEHLGKSGYIPAWRARLSGTYEGMLDLAVITTPDTRWNNFYLEGLRYIVEKACIDGLYIDDTALDRVSLQRARRILDAANPHSRIDLHSWNHFNGLARFASCAVLYMEVFPYVNRIWFGEGFDYDAPPDYWLTEICGIPYGVMGEMLQGGGNPWRGMLYGMTTRLGWSGDPRPLWQYFDAFGIRDTALVGYWDSACPVKTDGPDVPATVYKGDGKALIALASWSKVPQSVRLQFDATALGFDPGDSLLTAPHIRGYQDAHKFDPADPIPVAPGKGWLLELHGTPLGSR
jgi:hypothetical protein